VFFCDVSQQVLFAQHPASHAFSLAVFERMQVAAESRAGARKSAIARTADMPILVNISLFHSTIRAIGRVERYGCVSVSVPFSGRAFCGTMRACERRPPDCSSASRWFALRCSRPFSRCRRNGQPLRNQIAVRKCWRARANVMVVRRMQTHRTPRQGRHVVLPSIAAWCFILQMRSRLSRKSWFSEPSAEAMSMYQSARIDRLFRRRAWRRFDRIGPRSSWRGGTLTLNKEEYEIHPFDRSDRGHARHGFGHVRQP
jgi:hypothetical protein